MLYDISPLISPRLAVWPGDDPCSREVVLDMRRGDATTLSTLRATAHLGAHADAPSHYSVDGAAIHERSLDYYLGPCQVVRVAVPPKTRITLNMLPEPIVAPRVLIATGSFPDPNNFNEDFSALSPDLIESFAGQGVKLIGIDTPSVDLFDSTDLPSHRMFLKLDMANLEGLALGAVAPGCYELIALPLRLEGFDASPVRAVLRTL